MGHFDEALTTCAVIPKVQYIKALRALCLIRQGKTEEGEVVLQHALAAVKEPDDKSEVLYYQGRALAFQNKKNEARAAYQEAAKVATDCWLKAKIFQRLKDVEP